VDDQPLADLRTPYAAPDSGSSGLDLVTGGTTGAADAAEATSGWPETEPLPAVADEPDPVDAGTYPEVGPDDDDEAFVRAVRTRRVPRLTIVLGLAILLAGSFWAGVAVQKSHDSGLASGGTGAAALRRAVGGTGGFGAPAGSGQQGAANAPTGGSSTGSFAGAAAIGQVVAVHGQDLVIRNFAGKTVTVHTNGQTAVSSAQTVALSALKAGATVTVQGTTASDGSVTATSVRSSK
jgi:outer membrane lipoprotein SlyB